MWICSYYADQMQMIEKESENREIESNVIIADLKEKLSAAEGKCMQLQGDLEAVIASKEEEIRQLRESVQNDEVAHKLDEGTSIKLFRHFMLSAGVSNTALHCLLFPFRSTFGVK